MRVAQKQVRNALLVAAVAAATVAGLLVWQHQRTPDPAAVFWEALEHGLTETAVTCSSVETTDATSSIRTYSLDLISARKLRTVTSLKRQVTAVTTEDITTTSGEFIRYTAISNSQTKPDGSKPEFSQLLNVWGRVAIDPSGSSLFGRTALGGCVVPLAHLTVAEAAPLTHQLRAGKIFATDFSKIKSAQLNGQAVDSYAVTIAARPYIDFMKQVAKAYGLHDLDAVDAASYDKKSIERMTFYISPRPARLQKIVYIGRQQTVAFSGYGIMPRIPAPKATISAQELQKRLTDTE